MAAIGRSGVEVDPQSIRVIMEDLDKEEVSIVVDLGKGSRNAIAWGCDLTEGYIKINTKYS